VKMIWFLLCIWKLHMSAVFFNNLVLRSRIRDFSISSRSSGIPRLSGRRYA
jgi:hypothetical protein